MDKKYEDLSLQQLLTPNTKTKYQPEAVEQIVHTVSPNNNNNQYQFNEFNADNSFTDYSQTEIAKLSKVEDILNKKSLKFNTMDSNNKLSLFQFAIMIFIITAGGPFGIEASIYSIGVFYTFLGLIIIPFMWALPQSLMSAELSSMMATNGNVTIWVYRAFCDNRKYGDFLGFINGLNWVIATGIDLPIYIVLLYQYFQHLFPQFEFNLFQQYFIKLFFVIIGALFNILNIQILGTASIIIAIIVLTPFIIGFIYTFQQTKISSDIIDPIINDEYDWTLGLSTLIWLYSGWDIMCMCCGEIKFRKKRLYLPFIIAIILDFFVYSLALFAATTINCDEMTTTTDDECWSDGYLSIVYDDLLYGLGTFVSIAAIFSNFGQYIILLSAHSRSLWAISQPYITLSPNGKMFIGEHEEEQSDTSNELETVVSNLTFDDGINHDLFRKIKIGIFPHHIIGTVWEKTQSPVRAVLIATLINAILISFSFQILVEISVFFSCFVFVFKFAAFIKLRYSEPFSDRPYKIWGGALGAWCILFCQFCLIMALIIVSIDEAPYVFIITIGINIIVSIWYLCSRYSCGMRSGPTSISSMIDEDISKTWYTSKTTKVKNIW